MVVHLIPVRRSAHDIFTGSYALLVLTPVAAPPAPPIELMRSLFDLTPSEARVARGLAVGETLEEIASAGGVAIIDRALAAAPGAGKDRMHPPGRSGVAARQRHARSKRREKLERGLISTQFNPGLMRAAAPTSAAWPMFLEPEASLVGSVSARIKSGKIGRLPSTRSPN